jgi:hypothetical protein
MIFLLLVMLRLPLGRVPQYRDKVTRGAQDNEQVPHEVKVADAFRHEKHRTRSVSDTARKQPE